ncbi:MAG: hypothetical protein PVSMB8_15260 [Vulcanimicrobiaceae bacterium]
MSYRARCARRKELDRVVPVYLGPGVSFYMKYRSFLKLAPGHRIGIEPIVTVYVHHELAITIQQHEQAAR